MAFDASFATQLAASAERLFDLIDRFHEAKVLIVGDLTLDEFLTGQVERLSREAPVLIIRHETTRQVPGGGANAVYNFAKLGAQVKAVGLLGTDDQGKTLRGIFEAAGIDTQGVLLDADRPTVTKTRISGHARQSVTQQIVRIDRKSDNLPDESLQLQLADYIQQHIGTVRCGHLFRLWRWYADPAGDCRCPGSPAQHCGCPDPARSLQGCHRLHAQPTRSRTSRWLLTR